MISFGTFRPRHSLKNDEVKYDEYFLLHIVTMKIVLLNFITIFMSRMRQTFMGVHFLSKPIIQLIIYISLFMCTYVHIHNNVEIMVKT